MECARCLGSGTEGGWKPGEAPRACRPCKGTGKAPAEDPADDWRQPTAIERHAIQRAGLNALQCIIIGDGVHLVRGRADSQHVEDEPDARLSEIMPR